MVEQAVEFFLDHETKIYIILGLFALYGLVKFFRSWNELRQAAFGMERDSAQGRLNQAATLLFLLLTMAILEFSVVNFIAPTMPAVFSVTPTIAFLATATTTPPATGLEDQAPGAGTEPTLTPLPGLGCTPDQIMISEPKDGDTISGVVVVRGTADIPNFGFYKYEIARPGETVWLSINAGEQPVREDVLGEWVTSVLPPGDYNLRLVVADNQGKFLPACIIQVRVIAEP
jgi:hypothetical protein